MKIMAKIVKREEKVILTATEKAILDKAHAILEEITDEVDYDGEIFPYTRDAMNELEYFLDEGKAFYEVEPPAENVSKVIVEITL